jgi:hypothetical protein
VQKNPYTDGECVEGRIKGLRSGILPSYVQYIKRETRWNVITAEEFHS